MSHALSRHVSLFARLFLLLGATFASAQYAPGTILELIPTGTVQPQQIPAIAAPLFEQFPVPRSQYAVDTFTLRYATTDRDGSSAIINARLFIPRFETPTNRPIYVFGSGTTGLADHCAPSVNENLGRYRAHMLTLAGAGFIGIMPDYLGFGDPNRSQPYFVAEAEARVMLDAIRALYGFFASTPTVVQPSNVLFTAGYSQGGHAAFAAADMRPQYAPEVPLSGVIGYGMTTNVMTLMREGPYYAPYISYSYSQWYGAADFNPAAILADRWLPTHAQDVNRLCIDGMQQFYPNEARQIYRPEFAASLQAGTLAQTHPSIYARLQENFTGLSGHGLPAFIAQGDQDIIVTSPAQAVYARQLCEVGSAVRYQRYPTARHRHTRPAAFNDTVAWMEAIFRGEPAPTDCGTF